MKFIAYYTNGSCYEMQKLLIEVGENTYASNLWQIAKQYANRFYQGQLVKIEVVQDIEENGGKVNA